MQQTEEGEKEEAKEEIELPDVQTNIQAEEVEEEYQSEGEEEAIELEKEPEVEEEGREKTEEVDEEERAKEEKERVEEAEEATEEEKDDAEEMKERFPDAADEDAVPLRQAEEGVDVEVRDDDEIPTEEGGEEISARHECQASYSQSSADEREGGEEAEEEVVKFKQTSEHEEEVNQEAAAQTHNPEQESVELSPPDPKPAENHPAEAAEQAAVSSTPPPLSLPESHCKTEPQESDTVTPSKTSTTTLHINLVSPSSEKNTSFFLQSPTSSQPERSESPSDAVSAGQTEEGMSGDEKQSGLEEEATPPDSVEETVSQPSVSSDQGKVRFTVAPAWQRSHSLTPPSSPPPALTLPGGEEVDPADPASSAKAELVLSPGRVSNAGSITAKPQGPAAPSPCSSKPQGSAAAGTEGNNVKHERFFLSSLRADRAFIICAV